MNPKLKKEIQVVDLQKQVFSWSHNRYYRQWNDIEGSVLMDVRYSSEEKSFKKKIVHQFPLGFNNGSELWIVELSRIHAKVLLKFKENSSFEAYLNTVKSDYSTITVIEFQGKDFKHWKLYD